MSKSPLFYSEQIYKISEETLMAHSIRAVERLITNHRKKDSRPQRELRYAIHIIPWDQENATIDKGYYGADIKIPKKATTNEKRKKIAHELGHLVLESYSSSNTPIFSEKTTEAKHEDVEAFAKDLIERHDEFYKNHALNDNKCLRFK